MHINQIWNLLIQQIKETDLWQWLATIFGIAEVLLALVNNIFLYPAGIISTAVSIYLLWKSGLYADSWLNVYYLVMSIYGWWFWIKKKDQPPVRITVCTPRDWTITVGIVIIAFAGLFILLKWYMHSTVPTWDAWVSATAWAGMWLLAKRKVENWILLNISNLFAIPLLFYKDLPLFAILTIILFIVAVFGYFDWRREYKQALA